MNSRYKYFIYLSFVFLLIALYNANYLKVPRIVVFPAIFGSLIFLFLGFICVAIVWEQILRKSDYSVSISESLAGIGLSIFSKYIPGKIWMIIGRAAYIAEKKSLPLGELTFFSLKMQLIASWIGLICGAFGLFLIGGLHIWGWLILFIWIVLTIVIFSNIGHSSAESFIRKILRKNITIPKLSIKFTCELLPWVIVNWALWSIGFYLLVLSLSPVDVLLSVGLGFPLSVTLGVMSLIAPGGLGAREGVMVGYLTLAGLSMPQAIAISVAARLWFLVGEVFIFIIGIIADQYLNPQLRDS